MDNPLVACRVIFGFFNSFKNVKFDAKFLESYSATNYLSLNLTNECPDI